MRKTQSENKEVLKKSGAPAAFISGMSSDLSNSFSSIDKMVENTLEIEFGRDFTKQAGFDKMVEKIVQAIKYDPELNQEALAVINKFNDQKDQQSYDNSARPPRRSH
jgi:hypothetical protein